MSDLPNQIVSEEELLVATGFRTRGPLARCLKDQGVAFLRGRGDRIWTTLGALDKAMGNNGQAPDSEVEF